MGAELEILSTASLQRSLDQIVDPNVHKVIEILATLHAKYFCTSMLDVAKYGRYSLNASPYTRFTSPIRRYADIIVRHQLKFVLVSGGKSKCNPHSLALQSMSQILADHESVAKIAQQHNEYIASR